MLHGFACKILNFPHPAAPALARHEPFHASALKAPPEAGRRGGESIARKMPRIKNTPLSEKAIVMKHIHKIDMALLLNMCKK